MKTKAFLEPGYFVDNEDLTIKEEDWEYTEPYILSVLNLEFSNFINQIVMIFRKLIDWNF